jgi:predicted nucleic acid-binding Zn finger protein
MFIKLTGIRSKRKTIINPASKIFSMNIKKEDDFYLVESSKPGKFYKVNPHMPMCDCPHFLFHQIKVHGECKHIVAVKEFMRKEGDDIYSEIVAKCSDWTDTIELMEKHGEKAVQTLIDRGELIENRGKVKRTE